MRARPMPARVTSLLLVWFTRLRRGRPAPWTVGGAFYADPTPPFAMVGFQVAAQAPLTELCVLPGSGYLLCRRIPSRAAMPMTIRCLAPGQPPDIRTGYQILVHMNWIHFQYIDTRSSHDE